MWLRLEGLMLALAALAGYRAAGGGWPAFVVFFILPDLIGLLPFVLASRRLAQGVPAETGRGRGGGGSGRSAGERRRGGGRPAEPPLPAPGWFFLYNAAHSTAVPLVLGLVGWWATGRVFLPLLGWLAHIGVDRSLGFGLRLYPYLRSTHLQIEEAPLRPRW
ncbi:MAG TPA: DUF4260 family protein [Thermaerobacter sp.]